MIDVIVEQITFRVLMDVETKVRPYQLIVGLKPHCIQSSRVLVPVGTSKSTLRRHGIQAVARVMATLLMQ
jgi:hypothetical protein